MKQINVVAAAIFNKTGELFIAKRAVSAHQGGLWEFPGGKIESGETAQQALIRELKEEIGITALSISALIKVEHDYGDKRVSLDVYTVEQFSGSAHGAEGQETRWIQLVDITKYNFPAANQPIIESLLKR